MYRVAVGMWAIQPRDFWAMTPREWWLVHDAKNTERNAAIRARGGLTGSDKRELYEQLQAAKVQNG